MAQAPIEYPIGIQTFEEVRKLGYVYVDKTKYVYKMASKWKYYFLSRPRRFGKSLLVSTLKSYFEGKKELFKGLAVEELETEWKAYPVIHLDMSDGKGRDEAGLRAFLIEQLEPYEEEYGVTDSVSAEPNSRFSKLIRSVYAVKGQVVVLIDEYDAPMLEVAHEEENFAKVRNVMKYFYGPLKTCEPYLRFVFMTGITKFSQVSIFSALNNIKNISMLEEYAAICGITEQEMLSQMTDGLDKIAAKKSITREETVKMMKEMYDGYHFTVKSPDIYNPYSLINAFSDGELNSYWFETGTPTYLVEMFRKFKVKPYQIRNLRAEASDFDAPTERMTSVIPLLYQSGYITITGYSDYSKLYTLDIPNTEVRIGLMKTLLANYVPDAVQANVVVGEMAEHIHFGRMNEALKMLQEYLRTIPQTDNTDYEGHYQSLLFVVFNLLGANVSIEERTVDGRMDAVLRTEDKIYIMELKIGKTADAALRQIEDKDYAAKFKFSGLPVIKVGISFDKDTRTISDWIIK